MKIHSINTNNSSNSNRFFFCGNEREPGNVERTNKTEIKLLHVKCANDFIENYIGLN